MRSIFAALLVLCIWSQADGATKAKPPQLKPISRATQNKIMAEVAIVPPLQTRPAALPLFLNKDLLRLSQSQRPASIAELPPFLGKRYTFELAAMRSPKATYWQLGCGKFSVGLIQQGRNSYHIFSAGPGLAPCSYQQGKYTALEPIQPGLSLGGTVGGGPFPVVNVPFASYTATGFHHIFSDGFKIESIGKGTPQGGIALTYTRRTK